MSNFLEELLLPGFAHLRLTTASVTSIFCLDYKCDFDCSWSQTKSACFSPSETTNGSPSEAWCHLKSSKSFKSSELDTLFLYCTALLVFCTELKRWSPFTYRILALLLPAQMQKAA